MVEYDPAVFASPELRTESDESVSLGRADMDITARLSVIAAHTRREAPGPRRLRWLFSWSEQWRRRTRRGVFEMRGLDRSIPSLLFDSAYRFIAKKRRPQGRLWFSTNAGF